MKTEYFDYAFQSAGQVDIGKRRKSNQDEIILDPEIGLFGVSDGMGGLENGAEASAFVKKGLSILIRDSMKEWDEKPENPKAAGEEFADCVRFLSDRVFVEGNRERRYRFGATVAGALLYRNKAIFVSLGDSRGYVLRKYKRKMEQITEDMNLAGVMVRAGEMTKEEALNSPLSSRLTAFVGMEAPASPEVFITEIRPGDRILLCSDGLYGMLAERNIARILRSSKKPERVCERLIEKANENGGRDNISAVYVMIK